jgi:hypothetical protein
VDAFGFLQSVYGIKKTKHADTRSNFYPREASNDVTANENKPVYPALYDNNKKKKKKGQDLVKVEKYAWKRKPYSGLCMYRAAVGLTHCKRLNSLKILNPQLIHKH